MEEQELLTDLAFGNKVVSAVKFEFILTTLCLQDQEGLLTSCQVFHLNCQLLKICAYVPMKAEFTRFSLLFLCNRNNEYIRPVSDGEILGS